MERSELTRFLRHGRQTKARTEAAALAGDAAVIVEERDPERFMNAFAAAAAGSGNVFLADPSWGESERRVVAGFAEAGRGISGMGIPAHASWEARAGRPVPLPGSATPVTNRGWLMIPSGGTGGHLKFARHDQDTLAAAVGGFIRHFGVTRVNCVGVLPLHHVSGLMAWMRAAMTGGHCIAWDWQRLEQGDFPAFRKGAASLWALSVVPTQLHRLMASKAAIQWLRKLDVIFVGGGPIWPQLGDQAAREKLPVSLTYGMTETAAMVAAQRPGEFLAGDRSCGSALPHVRFEVVRSGQNKGQVLVRGESIFRGYYAEPPIPSQIFETGDIGHLDDHGRLTIEGRFDDLIITGGKKVDPQEVEQVLLGSGLFKDVGVVGIPDLEWGQSVVAFYPADQPAPDPARLAVVVAGLTPHKRPRRYVPLKPWPRNAQGKLNRVALLSSAWNLL